MADSDIGRILRDRYQIDSPVGSGPFWALYRGTDLNVDRDVLIKVYPPELREFKADLFGEARVLSRIKHRNVLEVFDIGEDADGSVFVVYENFPGEILDAAIRERGQFPVQDAVDIVRQIAAADTLLAQAKPAYGSLSTGSVLLGEDTGLPLIKCFDHFSGSGANFPVSGRPAHRAEIASCAAPEVIAGSDADERSDVYSLGAILYQLLAGDLPFGSGSREELSPKIMEEPPAPLSSFRHDLPEGLETVILTAMATNPEMRYQTAAELSDALDSAVSGVAAAGEVRRGQELWKTAVIVGIGILLLASALIYATYTKQTNPSTALQPDANGQPVQPLNPATGAQELGLANLSPLDTTANSNMAVPPGTLPGGDNYDPWKNGGQPPPGAPNIGPGGQVITIDPNNPSQFMPPDGGCIMQPSGILLCPAPLNANKAAKPTPTPKGSTANANVAPSPAPKSTPEAKPTPTPAKTEVPAKPAATPRPAKSPAAKPGQTGAVQKPD
jgi:hypothetical protein